MKQGTKRLASMAFALVFIVASFVVYFELTQPAYESLQKILGERQGHRQFLDEQKPAVKKVQDLIADYTGENAAIVRAALSQTLPLGPDISNALVQIEGLVQASKLNLTSLTPETNHSAVVPSTKPLVKPMGTLSFRVSFTGSYNQIKDFFSKLENNVLFLEVRSLSIQPGAKAGIDFFTGSVEVVSYYQQI